MLFTYCGSACLIGAVYEQGCRLTVVRKIICECIFVHRDNCNAEQILKEARQLDAAISLTSIYRVIGALKSAQIY